MVLKRHEILLSDEASILNSVVDFFLNITAISDSIIKSITLFLPTTGPNTRITSKGFKKAMIITRAGIGISSDLKITYSGHIDLSVKFHFHFHCNRNYTNLMPPVASSAIDSTGQDQFGLQTTKHMLKDGNFLSPFCLSQ